MTGKSEIYFLHGFWGTPDDFQETQKYLSDFHVHNLSLTQFSPKEGLRDFADRLNGKAKVTNSKKYLVGYSMGGRLALHALMTQPEVWAGAVLVSTHPGLREPADKAQRTHWQNQWAEKFLNLPQEQLEQEWQSQEVFTATTQVRKTTLAAEDRHYLAAALTYWGSDRHLFNWSELKKSNCPLLWCVGEEDHKYQQLLKVMRDAGLPGEMVTVPKAGHRIIFDQPEWLAQKITTFIRGKK